MSQFPPATDSSPDQSLGRASTALLATVVCLAIGLALVPGVALGDDEREDDRPYATQDATNVSIDESLAATEGTIEISVGLTSFESGDVEALKTHAAQTRTALETFASQTDGVTVLNTFWLANSVLLEVDTDRVSLDAIASVDNVESLSPNSEMSAHTGDGGDGQAGVGTPSVGDFRGDSSPGGSATVEDTTESSDPSRTAYEHNAHDDAHENDGDTNQNDEDGDGTDDDAGSTGAFGSGFGIFVALVAGGGLAAVLARRH